MIQSTTDRTVGQLPLSAFLTATIWLNFASCADATVFEFDGAGQQSIASKLQVANAASLPKSERSRPNRSTKRHSRYRDLSREVARAHSGSAGVRAAGLDAMTFVDVFEAMIERESAFKPTVISKKGAKGLGQLMPGTASDLGVKDPFDPEANLKGSVTYLTDLMLEFGSTELALAAYNAGPQRVKQYGGIPPFKETQAYVKWIVRKAGIPREAEQPPTKNSTPQTVNHDQPLNGEVSVWEF